MPSIDVVVPGPPGMPEDEEKVEEENEDSTNATPATLPVIGIIYPPPEVRNIVDKTASFVARNGPEFESRIRQNELGNPKFNFLNTGDPYHSYYQHKVKEFKEGRGQEVSSAGSQAQKSIPTATQLKQQEFLKQAQVLEQPFVPKDPPPEFEFIADPPSISALDLDIVKLTAQFVARNGRQFLTTLMNKEQRNYQFDFLRPQHSLFQYFTKLLEQYTKILIPPKDLVPRLKDEASSSQIILDQVKYRADWQKHQEDQRRREEMLIEKERIAYAQIDWHDFVVVETVDYQVGEMGNFPPPTTPEEVGARVLLQDRATHKRTNYDDEDENEMLIGSDDEMLDRTGRQDMESDSDGETENDRIRNAIEARAKDSRDNTQVEDMEEESSSESEEEERVRPPPLPIDRKQFGTTTPALPPLPPAPDKVIVKKGYDPKLHPKQIKTTPADELISPLTGTKIPANKVQEHMRIGLLDPRWVEQRDKHILDKMNQESVYAPGTAIEASLKQLAERRTDIFGIGDEETAIGKKIGEEDVRKDDKITWDGHTSSVEAATRAARANITIEDQIHQIHKVKGLLPDEEKEKIGPKPVLSDGMISKPPTTNIQSIQSAPTLSQKPLPPPPPPGILPTPPQQVMLIPGTGVPQMQPRPPMMGDYVQQQFAMMPPGTANLPPQSYGIPQQPHGMPQQPHGMPQQPHVMPQQPHGMPQQPPLPPNPPMQPGMKHGMMEMQEDEPVVKKARTEESLESEEQFLSKNQGPVRFKVALPNMPEKAEWKVAGQTLELTLPLTDSVAVIKAKVHEVTSMPPGKQKLNWEGLFLKDSNSLAYYNISPTTVLQLQLKERGGRKK